VENYALVAFNKPEDAGWRKYRSDHYWHSLTIIQLGKPLLLGDFARVIGRVLFARAVIKATHPCKYTHTYITLFVGAGREIISFQLLRSLHTLFVSSTFINILEEELDGQAVSAHDVRT
jgi:hypothetical protein